MLLCSEKKLDTISVFLNFLRLILCHSMQSILENVLCALEENVYSALWEWNILCIFNNSVYSVGHLRPVYPYWSSVWRFYSLLNVGFWNLLLLLLLFIYPLNSVKNSVCFMCFGALILDTYTMYSCCIYLVNWPFYHSIMSCVACDNFYLQFCLCPLSYHLYGIFFPSFHFQPIYILKPSVSFL